MVRVPLRKNFSLRNFGNSVYPALPVSFGGDSNSHRSLLSGVYARRSKISHQSALECIPAVDSTAHSKSPRSASMRLKTLPCTEKERRRRNHHKPLQTTARIREKKESNCPLFWFILAKACRLPFMPYARFFYVSSFFTSTTCAYLVLIQDDVIGVSVPI